MQEKQNNFQGTILKRSIGLSQLVFIGVGTILGAGIFVVIGEVIAEAQHLAPIAYILAGLVAVPTAISFGKLGSHIPTAGGPIDYIEKAFGKPVLGSLAGWLLIAANIISAATITTGFVNYLGIYVEIPDWITASILIGILATVAVIGIQQSAWFMSLTTCIGIVTLIAVIVATWDGLLASPGIVIDTFSNQGEVLPTSLFAGAFLAIYSFIGFGDMAQTAEEVKDVQRNLPKAIIISICVVFFFYLIVSASLIGLSDIEKISKAQAPLVAAVKMKGWPGWPIGIASLFVIVNGALTQILASSRLLMDISRDKRGAPAFFADVNPTTQTPLRATVLLAAVVLILAIFIPLKSLAEMTGMAILLVFTGVNAALVQLKRLQPDNKVFNVPLIIPIAGTVICGGVVLFEVYKLVF